MNSGRSKQILMQTLMLGWLWTSPPGLADPLRFESGTRQTQVLELYTSHGCDSCPPADAWFRTLAERPELWRDLIPLAFHVDYWDGPAWRDRFSAAEFGQRQRSYHAAGAVRTIVTPGFVLAGREWKGWYDEQPLEIKPGPEVGRLKLVVEPGREVGLSFQPVAAMPTGELTAQLAVLGFGLSSPIGGGENAGRRLEEDFVVLGLSQGKPLGGEGREWRIDWPQLKVAEPGRRALVAWISRAGDPKPLQAVGDWLP